MGTYSRNREDSNLDSYRESRRKLGLLNTLQHGFKPRDFGNPYSALTLYFYTDIILTLTLYFSHTVTRSCIKIFSSCPRCYPTPPLRIITLRISFVYKLGNTLSRGLLSVISTKIQKQVCKFKP